MCGIAGFVSAERRPIECAKTRAAVSRLEHRGPDDAGFAIVDGDDVAQGRSLTRDHVGSVLLIHQRLSIIELSELGHQPMSTPDDRFLMVFNGELYNYIELRAELQQIGCQFRGQSDSEVLLQAFALWGTAAFKRFVGMFAVAIFDRDREILTLARDHFGIKPLYLSEVDSVLHFASEIPALLQLAEPRRELNPQRVFDYLRFGMTDHGADTMIAGVQQMQPGHYAEIAMNKPGRVVQVPFYQPQIQDTRVVSEEAAAAEVRRLFLRSVDLHLRSDVPVGTSLSGGIDSSAIVMATRMIRPDIDRHAFSYVARGTDENEEKYAELVAKKAGCHLHKVEIDMDQVVADLDLLVRSQGEPFGSSRIYAQFCVFRAASDAGIKVMLDGQGADEMLAGYHTYLGARLASTIRSGQLRAAAQLISATPSGSLQSLLHAGRFLLPARAERLFRRSIGRDMVPSWLNPGWFNDRDVSMTLSTPDLGDTGGNILLADLSRSVRHTNLPKLLRYEDRNSMTHSVESRVPFLEPNLLDYVFSLPEDQLLSNRGMTKAVFRRAMEGIVPAEILNRRDKIGFATPEEPMNNAMKTWSAPYFESDSYPLPAMFNEAGLASFLGRETPTTATAGFPTWRIRNFVAWHHMTGIEIS